LVFAPKHRQALISREWHQDLEKYATGVIQNQGHKLLAIGSMPDHIHIFIGYNINQLIPDLVSSIKTSTNNWIKENNLSKSKFDWQRGYGAFTHSRRQLDTVVRYIRTQEQHHRKKTFQKEYLKMLKDNEVAYDKKYLFEFFS
jgi:REP element-mobilizing transposase RayT